MFLDSISIYHCLGRSLKEYPKFAKVFLPEFTKIENARLYFFERFVDFGEYENYYKEWLMIYKNEETNPIKLLWVESLMIWGEELVDSNLNWNRYNSLLSNIKN